MTHDCDRATELLERVKRKRDVDAMVVALLQKNARGCDCYQAGYLNGQQADVVTFESLAGSMAETAGWLAAAALLVLAGRFVAGWAGLEALEFASGFVAVGCAAMAVTGFGLRAWRRLKGGASET